MPVELVVPHIYVRVLVHPSVCMRVCVSVCGGVRRKGAGTGVAHRKADVYRARPVSWGGQRRALTAAPEHNSVLLFWNTSASALEHRAMRPEVAFCTTKRFFSESWF